MESNYWERRRIVNRLSRRGFIGAAGTAAAGAAGLAMVGCGGGNSNSKTPAGGSTAPAGSATAGASASPSETPVAGGTYTDAFTGPFAGVDPHNSVYGGARVVPELYNYLVRDYLAIFPQRGILQDLAESQQLQSDNVTMVFKIRPGVKIAANTKGIAVRDMDSSDVLASWNRIGDPKSGSNGYAFVNKWVAKMDAPDPSTFRMVMKEPYAWTLNNVGSNLIGAIVPKEWLESPDLKKTAVGAGAFTLSELVEGDHAKMDKNPTYYRSAQGIPYLDHYIIRSFADQATYRTAFTVGQLDVYDATNKQEAENLANADKSIHYDVTKSLGYNSFWMRVDTPPWTDERVRNAVNMAINRDQYVQIIGQGQGSPIGPLTYAFEKYALSADELKAAQPFNPADAKKAFEAAGVTEFGFSHPTSSNVADYVNIFVKNMQDAGVTAKPQPLDAGTWVAQYYTSKLTASLSLNQSYTDPDFALRWYTTGGITGNGNYATGYYLPEIDKAAHDAANTLDENQRITKYKDLQKLILSKSPAFLNFFGVYSNTLVYKYVHNYPFGLSTLRYPYTEDIWTTKKS
ncbi:MAG TPA: ABC transporter substrate-binding protein [Tepidiformaceae bacterium]|nr:ABC transporter substrate-binding protein [Tepidiformaceae bacterium]